MTIVWIERVWVSEWMSEWRSKWTEERKLVWFIWPGGHCANSTFDHRFKGDSSKAGNHSLTVESLPRLPWVAKETACGTDIHFFPREFTRQRWTLFDANVENVHSNPTRIWCAPHVLMQVHYRRLTRGQGPTCVIFRGSQSLMKPRNPTFYIGFICRYWTVW